MALTRHWPSLKPSPAVSFPQSPKLPRSPALNPLQALILTERTDDPAYRYRIESFLPALAAEGIAAETVTLRRGLLERTRQLAAVGGADVVILQRKLMSVVQVGVLRGGAADRLRFG